MKKIISVILLISLICTLFLSAVSCSSKKNADGPVAYILAEKGNAYSLGLAESFKYAFEEKGGVTTMETFPSGTTDFSEFFEKSAELEAAVIFLPNSMSYAKDLLESAKDHDVEVPIIAGDTWETLEILDIVKSTGLEVYFAALFEEDTAAKTEVGDSFVSGFKRFLAENSEYYDMNGGNDTIASVSALGFDAYNVAMAAIREAAKEKGTSLTSTDVARALWKTDHKGITGDIVFDEMKDAIRDTVSILTASDDGSTFKFVKNSKVKADTEPGKALSYEDGGITIDIENKKITVGVYQPTTGGDAAGGKHELLGVIYANYLDKIVEIDGEEYTVVLSTSDNGSLPEYTEATATKLVEDRSIVVIGSYGSTVSIAATGIFEAAKIPVIGASCTNSDVTFGNKYYFRTAITDTVMGEAMAAFAYDMVSKDK